MTYTYAYNRTKGCYEVRAGKKIVAEKATMQEAKTFVDGKTGSLKVIANKKQSKELGFGDQEVPAFFLVTRNK